MRRLQPALAFAADGEHVLFSGDVSGQFNLWRVPVRGARGWPEQLTSFTDHAVRQLRVSPDGRRLLVVELRSNTDQSLYLVDADGAEARELTPHDAPAKFLPGPWTSDGSGFFLLTDEGREFSGLALYRLAEGRYEWVEAPDADLEEVAGSREAGVVAWLENRDGWGVLRARDAAGDPLPEPQLPQGCAYALGSGLT